MTPRHGPSGNEPRILTPDEAADLLGVARWEVYRMAESGELHHFRIGRSLRIPETALSPARTRDPPRRRRPDK